ncbi:MAG: accessory factor UbiK family protein [Pseudomonadota bacterium]
MAERNPLFEDFAKVASSAMSTLGGLRDEAQAALKTRMEDMLADMDLVTSDEFEAVRTMALKAREENEKLLEEIAALKAAVAPKPAPKRAAPRKTAATAKKPAAKKPARKPAAKRATKPAAKA